MTNEQLDEFLNEYSLSERVRVHHDLAYAIARADEVICRGGYSASEANELRMKLRDLAIYAGAMS